MILALTAFATEKIHIVTDDMDGGTPVINETGKKKYIYKN